MTQPKKGKPSAQKTVEKVKVKDSTEIDDLFSVLSSKKLSVTVEKATKESANKKEETKKKPSKKPSDEVTLSDLEGLEDEDGAEGSDSEEGEDCEKDVNVTRGTAYDPKNDDQFPATSAASSANDSDFFDSRGLKRKTRALTDDGYPIYTPKELKIGMGGGTDLCPFECNCCF